MSPLSLSVNTNKRICRLHKNWASCLHWGVLGFYILCKKLNRNRSAGCGFRYKKQFPTWGIELVVKRFSVQFGVFNRGGIFSTWSKSKLMTRTSHSFCYISKQSDLDKEKCVWKSLVSKLFVWCWNLLKRKKMFCVNLSIRISTRNNKQAPKIIRRFRRRNSLQWLSIMSSRFEHYQELIAARFLAFRGEASNGSSSSEVSN